tara:strand:+ start:6032 stop:6814 length:783 start_codon:yes stop_codon:yes gene_type:complete
MERILKKLKEIKEDLNSLNQNSNDEEFKALKNRTKNIAIKQFGKDNDYSKRIDSIEDFLTERYKHQAIGIVDLMIDEIELVETKEKLIKEPLIQQEEIKKEQNLLKSLTSKIFIVHGHNDTMRETVARTVEKLGLKSIILHEQANIGDTIIEKLTRNSNVNFAIVLLSADDKGGLKNDPLKSMKFRARQNVIFELGYFIGKLGRKRVIVLFEDIKQFEIPSDYQGIVYIPYKINSDDWKLKLSQELIESGYSIDLNKLLG